MKKGELEHSVIIGKIEERRGRGYKREKKLDGLAKWLGTEKGGER